MCELKKEEYFQNEANNGKLVKTSQDWLLVRMLKMVERETSTSTSKSDTLFSFYKFVVMHLKFHWETKEKWKLRMAFYWINPFQTDLMKQNVEFIRNYELLLRARQRREIVIGYRLANADKAVINPPAKNEQRRWSVKDVFVVIAEKE
ncbi:hypothetical protein Vadar_015512 [Vaccinium darrowii]|uniref:Uncharacterized protein n=1 Tax=Vaccinium darrowii TaxID=229202 RepID=A0ACB7YWP4_9ERIC|nr:hypothetical protein Vadar_015512 [Vaccinium darrowii]